VDSAGYQAVKRRVFIRIGTIGKVCLGALKEATMARIKDRREDGDGEGGERGAPTREAMMEDARKFCGKESTY